MKVVRQPRRFVPWGQGCCYRDEPTDPKNKNGPDLATLAQ